MHTRIATGWEEIAVDLSRWFHDQLAASADGFVWAVRQVPPERRTVQPPAELGLGEWGARGHTFHLYTYERYIALPSMSQWLGGPEPSLADSEPHIKAAWDVDRDLDSLLAKFCVGRDEQIALLARVDEALWEEERHTVWGDVSLRWVVTKTYQHNAEHTHDVLRLALFWP